MKSVLILQNCTIESAGTIIDYLNDRDYNHSVVLTYRNEPIPDPSEFDAVINLGCPISATKHSEHDYLSRLYDFVVRVAEDNHHYLGICFGGQILAMALGARVTRNPSMEIGTFTVKLTDAGKGDPLFAGFDSQFPVFHWHGDTFGISKKATALAEGELCRNQAFRSGNAVGIQFHLETDARDVAVWCEDYAEELATFGSSAERVIAEFGERSHEIRKLNYLMLDNFFREI